MRKITMTMFAMFTALAFAATASAGDDKAKPKDAKGTTTSTTSTTTTTTTTTTKGGAAGGGSATSTTATADASMQMPDPAPELTAMAKTMKGSWKCVGTMNDMQGNAMPAKGSMKWALDLDKMWIKGTLKVNKIKGQKRGYTATFYRTYGGGTWAHVAIGNMGDYGWATSKGPDADGKVTWEGEAHMGGMVAKTKDYDQKGEKKNSQHIWGEVSMDGKSWMPAYDMTCTK